MKAKDLRQLSEGELLVKEKELGEELFNLRFQHATGQLENVMRIPQVKRDIARLKTILKEKALTRENKHHPLFLDGKRAGVRVKKPPAGGGETFLEVFFEYANGRERQAKNINGRGIERQDGQDGRGHGQSSRSSPCL